MLLLFAVDVRRLLAVGLHGYLLLTPRLLPSFVVIDIASVSGGDRQRYVPSAATTTKLRGSRRSCFVFSVQNT